MPEACKVCRSPDVSPEPFYYFWRSRRWWLVRCESCSHQFVHPRLSRREQELIYDDTYFSKDGDWTTGAWHDDYLSCEPKLRDEAREVLGFLPSSGGRLLDIGCAGGIFLDEARSAGFRVTGVELNPSMVRHARKSLSLDVVAAAIEDVPEDAFDAEFDTILLLDCLEHVPEPGLVADQIARWLAPGGSLLIRGPMKNRLIDRLKEELRRRIWAPKRLPGYPLDLNHFNKRSLRALLERAGCREWEWFDESRNFANLVAKRNEEDGQRSRELSPSRWERVVDLERGVLAPRWKEMR